MKKTVMIAATALSLYPALLAAEVMTVGVFAMRGEVTVQN